MTRTMTRTMTRNSALSSWFLLAVAAFVMAAVFVMASACDRFDDHKEEQMRVFTESILANESARAALRELYEATGEKMIAVELSGDDGTVTGCRLLPAEPIDPNRDRQSLQAARDHVEPKFCAAIREVGGLPRWVDTTHLGLAIPPSEIQTVDAARAEG